MILYIVVEQEYTTYDTVKVTIKVKRPINFLFLGEGKRVETGGAIMKVSELAESAGISVRTLHHYDEIGLLKADELTESGYRVYSKQNAEQLQQILFFRELGFPLKQIKEIIQRPEFDRIAALQSHRTMLENKRNQLDLLLRTIELTLREAKGEIDMTNEERFAGFDFSSNPYEKEARERWGDNAVDSSNKKLASYDANGKQQLEHEMNILYRELAAIRHLDPATEEAQLTIAKWYDMLNKFGTYTPEAFRGLGEMYMADERFTQNIDRFGAGLSLFMSKAMAVFADNCNS